MAEAKKTAKTAKKAVKPAVEKETKDGITQEDDRATDQTDQQTSQEVEATEAAPAEAKEVKATKAGKRAPKALKEAEEKEAKEERKAGKADAEEAPKTPKPKTRTKLERAGKKLRKVAELVEKEKLYTLKEAVELATKTSITKFDATVEVHVNLNVDPRQADQNVRDNLVLPNGTGRTIRVAVLAEADDAAAAKKAGADIAGNEELLKEIEKGKIEFDTLIATPALMAKLGKFARVLGPKGLMPNPKSGTVTPDVVKAVQQAKAGRVEYRVDSTGIVHLGAGKVSFGADKLMENIQAVFVSLKSNKPGSIKNVYVKSITISTTMGPGIKVLISEL